MATKLKRKRKPSNITTLDTSQISLSAQERWVKEICDFARELADHEVKLMKELLDIIDRKPRKNKTPCEIINFAKWLSRSGCES